MQVKENISSRVAYLSYDGLTDPLGQSQILPYVLGLEAKGFEFVIISFEKPAAYQKGRSNIEATIAGKKIKWLPLRYHKNPPVLSTLFDVYCLWKAVRREHKQKPINILHCRSYLPALVGLRMKRQAGIKFIFDMRGFWADERVEGGLWNLKNPLYKFIFRYFKKVEKEFLAEADNVISLTENARQEILSWGLNTAPITVIPTCVDLDLFNPEKIKKEDQEKLRAQLGIKEENFILLYLGSWGTWYLTKEMLELFSNLKKQKSEARFLIVSADNINLEGYTYKNDVIVTQAPRNLVPLYISLANASVFFIKPSYSKKASSATKMGEIIAMEVPFITNAGWGDIDRLSNRYNGFILEELTNKAFTESVLMLNDPRVDLVGPSKAELSLDFGVNSYQRVYLTI